MARRKDVHELIEEAFKKRNDNEPLAKQLQFEAKVAEATENLKSFVTEEVTRIEQRKTVFWRLVGITFFSLNVILLIASPWEIGRIVAEKVNESVIDPNVRMSLDEVVRENSSGYVEKQLGPFKKTVDDLRTKILQLGPTLEQAEALSRQAQSITGSLQQQSNSMKSQVDDVKSTLSEISLISLADHDNRAAFDQLKEDANNPQSRYRYLSQQVLIAIGTSDALEGTIDFNVAPWSDKYKPDMFTTMSIDDFRYQIVNAQRADLQSALLDKFWNSDRFSKLQKLDFIMDIIRTSQSIAAVRHAERIANSECHLNMNPIACDQYLSWWDKNREKFKVTTTTQSIPVGVPPAK